MSWRKAHKIAFPFPSPTPAPGSVIVCFRFLAGIKDLSPGGGSVVENTPSDIQALMWRVWNLFSFDCAWIAVSGSA